MEETIVVGVTWDACGPVVSGYTFCRAGHRFAVTLVSTTILILKYPDASLFCVWISQNQTNGVEHLFEHILGCNSCFL